MEFQVTEAEKEKFRKYIEKSGAIDSLVRSIATIYDSKDVTESEQVMSNFKKSMGVNIDVDTEKLSQDYKKVKEENFKLKKLIDQLQFEIDTIKSSKAQK